MPPVPGAPYALACQGAPAPAPARCSSGGRGGRGVLAGRCGRQGPGPLTGLPSVSPAVAQRLRKPGFPAKDGEEPGAPGADKIHLLRAREDPGKVRARRPGCRCAGGWPRPGGPGLVLQQATQGCLGSSPHEPEGSADGSVLVKPVALLRVLRSEGRGGLPGAVAPAAGGLRAALPGRGSEARAGRLVGGVALEMGCFRSPPRPWTVRTCCGFSLAVVSIQGQHRFCPFDCAGAPGRT